MKHRKTAFFGATTILFFATVSHGCGIYNNNAASCKLSNKKLTNWLGQAKRCDANTRSKAVRDGILGVFRDNCGPNCRWLVEQGGSGVRVKSGDLVILLQTVLEL